MDATWAAHGGAFPLRYFRERRPADAPLPRIERWGVGLLVVALHLLLAASLQRLLSGRPSTGGTEPAMQLVYVHWLPRMREPRRPAAAIAPAPKADAAARIERAPPVEAAAVAASPTVSDAPLRLSLPTDDRWTADTGERTAQAAAARVLHRRNPVPPPPPERFRMIDRSPAAIVRMVAMGLFWPPGYNDDPCDGVDKAIDAFSRQARSARDRGLLEDAMLQKSRYCP